MNEIISAGRGPVAPLLSSATAGSAASVRIRRVRPADAAALERFYANLSTESRRLRFLGAVSGLSHLQATNFCTPDHDHREGFLAVLPRFGPDDERIVGHLCIEPDGDARAEVAIAIADEWQRHGLGLRLMLAGLTWAHEAGVRTFCATMYAANPGIHRLLLGLGLPAQVRPLTQGISEITIDLVTVATEAA